MRIEALIVAVLAANLHGCGTCCPPAPEVPFKIRGEIVEARLAVGAAWQAMHAEDAGHRAAFAEIAVDEAGHAQLAWDLHAWFVDRLDAASRAEVMAAQRAALAGLPALAAGEVCPPELAAAA